jgi:hypothetical protein
LPSGLLAVYCRTVAVLLASPMTTPRSLTADIDQHDVDRNLEVAAIHAVDLRGESVFGRHVGGPQEGRWAIGSVREWAPTPTRARPPRDRY